MESRQDRNLRRAYPEMAAGGFSRVDGSIEFYTRITALLRPDMVVLDIGAGRGSQLLDEQAPYRAALGRVQGKVARLVGVDVDAAVLENPYLDAAEVIDGKGRLPFDDAAFDLVYADWVLEHIEDPDVFTAEVTRVLKPGGWFCARTPNRFGITGIGTNLLPNRLHVAVLDKLQPDRAARDVFPTVYRINTMARLARYFPAKLWENASYVHNPEPPYVQRSRGLIAAVNLYFRATPGFLGTNLHAFLRTRETV